MSIDLAGQKIVLKALQEVYEGNSCRALYLHETSIPLSYGHEDSPASARAVAGAKAAPAV